MRIGIAAPIALSSFSSRLDRTAAGMPNGLGGTPTANLVEALLLRQHDITVFTLDQTIQEEVILKSRGIRFCICPCRNGGRARDLFAKEREGLKRAMEREMPDLVHAHWTYEFAMAALDSRRPVLVTAHDAPWRILRYGPNPYRLIRLWMARKVTARAAHLTAVSPHLQQHYRRYLGYRTSMPVIPNPIQEQVFAMGALRSTRRSERPFTVASVLTGWKGLKNGPAALRAFAMLRRSLPDARLLLFGADYAPRGAAETWARKRAVTEGVTFAGEMPNLALLQVLAAETDVLLHPSREESFGMTVAEAMALGLAIVGGRKSGAVPWLLENGRAGVLAEVTSPAHLAQVLLQLARDPELRQSLGNTARESAWKRFRPDVVVQQYESMYEKLLDRARCTTQAWRASELSIP